MPVNHEIKDGLWNVKLQGDLDEDIDLPSIPAGTIKNVTVDVGDVAHINSMGIRNWISWIRDIQGKQKAVTFEFERLPLMFIRLMENIAEMLPSPAKIKSFYVSFYCGDCMSNRNDLFVVGQGKPFKMNPSPECEQCKAKMEPELEDKTYESLAKQP